MSTNRKPVREVKYKMRRKVTFMLAIMQELDNEIGEDKRVPSDLRIAIRNAIGSLESAKQSGVKWWRHA